jgi:hypothetical protein
MDRLNVIRMVVSPRSSHAAGMDVVRYDIVVVGELYFAEGAFTVLDDDLLVEKFSHFSV